MSSHIAKYLKLFIYYYMLNSKYYGLGLALIISFMVFYANSSIVGPTIQADEGSYLMNAAAIAGFHNDFASSFHAGYPLLIAPAFLIADTPQSVWAIVKGINASLVFLTILLLWWVSLLLKPEADNWLRVSAVGLTAIYPMWVVMAGYSFAQIAFVPFFLLVYLFYHRSLQGGIDGGYLNWFITGILAGYLYWIHPTAIAVVFALLLGTSYLTWRCRSYLKYTVVLIIAALLMIIFYELTFTPWLFSRMTISDLQPWLHYPAIMTTLAPLLSYEGLKAILTKVGGTLFYLTIGTAGLIWVGVFDHTDKFRGESLTPDSQKRHINHSLFIFSVSAIIAVIGLSVLLFASTPGAQRLDHFMYGRYVEGVIAPFLLLGALAFNFRKAIWAIPISVICAFLLWLGLDKYTHIAYFNISAFWQAFVMPKEGIWLWLLSGILLITLVAKASRYMSIILIAGVFLFSSYEQIFWHDAAAFNSVHKWSSALLVRELYPVGTNVGFDHSGIDSHSKPAIWFDFGFVLFDYSLKRVVAEQWYNNPEGPLFSYDQDLNITYPEVNLIATTPLGGPFLWAKEYAGITLLEPMIWYDVNPASAHIQLLLGDGWHQIEPKHVWSAQEAVIYVNPSWFGVDGFPQQLVLKINAFGASPERPVDVIFETGNKQAEYVFDNLLVEEVDIPLGNGEVAIKIHVSIPMASSPSDLIGTEDARILGIGLHSFQFR